MTPKRRNVGTSYARLPRAYTRSPNMFMFMQVKRVCAREAARAIARNRSYVPTFLRRFVTQQPESTP